MIDTKTYKIKAVSFSYFKNWHKVQNTNYGHEKNTFFDHASGPSRLPTQPESSLSIIYIDIKLHTIANNSFKFLNIHLMLPKKERSAYLMVGSFSISASCVEEVFY